MATIKPETNLKKSSSFDGLPPAISGTTIIDSEIKNKYGIMDGTFKIRNINVFDVKDVEVHCFQYAKSGTLIGKNRKIIYETFPTDITKTISHFNMGFIDPQTVKVECRITNFSNLNY